MVREQYDYSMQDEDAIRQAGYIGPSGVEVQAILPHGPDDRGTIYGRLAQEYALRAKSEMVAFALEHVQR